jgi:GTPase SAR1 family protein
LFYEGNWIEDLSQVAPEATQVILVGNKKDLEEQREVSEEEAKDFAKQYNIPYMECSAKSGQSIEEAFYTLGKMMKDHNERKTSNIVNPPNDSPNNPNV